MKVCPRSRRERPEGHLLPPTQARVLQAPGPSIPQERMGGRYLGGWLPGLNGPQVLVQLRAQLGQLSLQQDLGRIMGRLGQWESGGGGHDDDGKAVHSVCVVVGVLVKGQVLEAQRAAGQSTQCLHKGQSQGTENRLLACVPAPRCVRVSGEPCRSLSRAPPS